MAQELELNGVELKPNHDFVLIQRAERKEKTAGGIVLPDSGKNSQTTGTIVAVGPGRWSERNNAHSPMSVQVGDEVLFNLFAAQAANIDGKQVVIVRDGDVVAVLNRRS